MATRRGERFALWVGALVMGIVVLLATAWPVMLGLGILHHQWPHIPAFGFWETWVLMLMVNAVGAGIKTGIKVKLDQ